MKKIVHSFESFIILILFSLPYSLLAQSAPVLPIDFESGTISYTFTNFDGGAASKIPNPRISGINTSANVGQMVKDTGKTWAGAYITLASPIDFSVNKIFKVKVFMPRAGAKLLLKVEDTTQIFNYQQEAAGTAANAWEELTFDFSAINISREYRHLVLIFDDGTAGDGSANYTYYFDDVSLTAGSLTTGTQMNLPVTFDVSTVNYGLVGFEGAEASTIVTFPTSSSNKVAQVVKSAAAKAWAGTTITSLNASSQQTGFSSKIPFTEIEKKMTVRVWSPNAGIKIRLKVEDYLDGTKSCETEAVSTIANGWETLSFDFSNPAAGTSALNLTYSYNKVSIFFNYGITGAIAGEKTYYFDDIKFVRNSPVLPVDFESTTINYTFTDFNGGTAAKIANPRISGINTSSNVVKMVKGAGEVWAGSAILLASPIDFSINNIFKVKVFMPKVGARLLLKVENETDNTIYYQREAIGTIAGSWEELSFDFSAVDVSKEYQRLVFIFDNDIAGDGSANFTYFFDDVKLTLMQMNLPVTFDLSTVNYKLKGFAGADSSTIVPDPASPSNKAAKVVKSATAESWAGTVVSAEDGLVQTGFSSKIPFTEIEKKMTVRVWSPNAGIKIRLKVEDYLDITKSCETEAVSTVAIGWETLTFDFGSPVTGTRPLDLANNYNKVTIFFNFGVAGSVAGEKTYYFDDIEFILTSPILPLDFESATIKYSFINFDGGAAAVTANQQKSGINTSSNVGKMLKGTGQTWAGSYISLSSPIDFSVNKIFKVKVFMPRAGAKLLVKVENATDTSINYQKEAAGTVANIWEELLFDFSAVDAGKQYQKLVFIFDNGTVGDGSANFTYLFDDIKLSAIGQGFKLVWSDEFNGTRLDTANWTRETGGTGWGNNELEYYTDREVNSSVNSGILTITALKETFEGKAYTSARLKTQSKKFFKYGRIEANIKLPYGQGIWPAFWMLGENISTINWPACGEIDIMELVGGGIGRDNKSYGTIHYVDNVYKNSQGNYTLPAGNFSDAFHSFSIIWNPTQIEWYVDDTKYFSFPINSDSLSEINDKAFILLNLAVGGNWPGSPNASTVLPQVMQVDYVRVYEDTTLKFLNLTSPYTTQIWQGGTTRNITWASSHIANIKIEFSNDGGKTFSTIAASVPALPNAYSWVVPNSASSQCLIKISDVLNSAVSTVSASTFSIVALAVTAPNGGESWMAGTTHNITWTSSNVANIKIELSTNGGAAFSTIASSVPASANRYSWVVPNSISAQCKIRISDVSNSSLSTVSTTVFSIVSVSIPSIILSSPNGGESWQVGTTHNITWTSSNVANIKIELSTNGGGTFSTIASSVPASLNTYSWVVPDSISNQCKINISDVLNSTVNTVSASAFSIVSVPVPTLAVTAPNGGESWQKGTTHNITWTNFDVSNVKIEYTTDNGSNWSTVISSVPAANNSYLWSIPNTLSTLCKVRISDVSNIAVNDISDNAFTIYLPSVNVTKPIGGEDWLAGSVKQITWQQFNADTVSIFYSTDGSANWNVLATVAGSLQSYSWTLPAITSSNTRVKIQSVSDSTINSVSPFFSIFTYPDTVTVASKISFNSNDSLTSYRMFGIPGKDDLPPSQVFSGKAKSDWEMVWNNGDLSNYQVKYDSSNNFNFKPGRGYWVISKTDLNITKERANVRLDTNNVYSIPLHKGWNIISNPFKPQVQWNAIQNLNSLDSNQVIYYWNGTWIQPAVLLPFEGYYFYNIGNLDSLKIPYNSKASVAARVNKITTGFNESIDLLLSDSKGNNSTVKIGFNPLSTDGFDKKDYFAPPSDFEAVSMHIHEDSLRNYNDSLLINYKDLYFDSRKEIGDGQEYTLIITNDLNILTKLTCTIPDQFKDKEVYIIERNKGKVYNLKELLTVPVPKKINKADYRLLAGSKSFIDQKINLYIIKDFILYQNYPNPFNTETKIAFNLPNENAVDIIVYDILGRQVNAIHYGSLTAGYNEINFSAKNIASGIYFYHIQAGKYSGTKKMVVLK